MPVEKPTLAFYYPGWIWHDPAWVKNLLLFFDGVALLVPDYMRNRPEEVDPALITGLHEHGLLTILEPEQMIDAPATAGLGTQLAGLLEEGLLDDLASPGGFDASISYSRLGFNGAQEVMAPILEELRRRGLAGTSEDGRSVPLGDSLRSLILTLLSQILRSRGAERGLDLAPATDLPQLQRALTELLNLPSLPSSGQVFSFDAEAVGVDLSAVDLEEILEFRADHGDQYRAYARGLRGTVAELAEAKSAEAREALLADRETELRETALDLAVRSKSRWQIPTGIALGIGGAAWAVANADLFGAMISVAGFGAAAAPTASMPADAFSYICEARYL